MDKYDLEERTTVFSEKLINFCSKIKNNPIYNPIISQLIRSGTSIGANYHEANAASSRKDFRNKIFICKKEAQETEYWLRIMLQCPEGREEVIALRAECHEFVLIFGRIVSTMNSPIENSKIIK